MSVFAQRVAYRGAVVEFLEPSSLQVGVQGVHYSVARNENPDCGYKRDYSIQIRTVHTVAWPVSGVLTRLNPQHPKTADFLFHDCQIVSYRKPLANGPALSERCPPAPRAAQAPKSP